MSHILYLASAIDEIEPWGRNVKLRDQQLRNLLPVEPMFLSALTSVCARNAAFSWTLEGPEDQVEEAQNLLKTANFGRGWEDLILRLSLDLYTQDSSAFGEIIREEDRPDSKVVGLASLDAGRCYPTGLPEAPVLYLDRSNRYHYLRWYQVFVLSEMPTPIEGLPDVQLSAMTRLLRAIRTNRDIQTYMGEKIGGRNMRAVTAVRGVSAEQITQAWNGAQIMNDAAGLTRYSNPLFVSSVSPSAEIDFKTFEIASIPDGFDLDTQMKWYVAQLALAFLSDYQEFAPLPGGGLGTASQSETQANKTKGKGPALFRKLISHTLNWLILPPDVEFKFDDIDLDAEATEAQNQKTRSESRKIRIDSGELTPQVARQLALEVGDLSTEQLEELERQDAEMKAEEEKRAAAMAQQQAPPARSTQPRKNQDLRLDDSGTATAQQSTRDDVVDQTSKAITGIPSSRYGVEEEVERVINETFDELFEALQQRFELTPEDASAV